MQTRASNFKQRGWASGLIALLGLLQIMPLAAQTNVAAKRPHDEVKAELLLVFAEFTEWPKGASPKGGTLVIGFVKSPEMKALTANEVKKDPDAKVRLVEVTNQEEAAQCHILYFGKNDRASLELLQAIGTRPILSVGEGKEFLQPEGGTGIMAFSILSTAKSTKVGFFVDTAAMKSANVRLHPSLLGRAAPQPGGRP